MKSIRLFLLVCTVATLILYNFIATFRGYQSSMIEADTLFDNQLLDLSLLVANLDTERISRDFRLGNNLAFQIWEKQRLLTASYLAPEEPIGVFTPGFEFANFGGYRWRTFTRLDENSGRWIIIAERTDLRFTLAENVVLESIAPVLLGIPIAGLLIWILVGIGLKPLNMLSLELRLKRAQDLSPLQTTRTPAELSQVVQSINGFIHRLSEALTREKRFSVDAAHELRTPISALKVQLHNLSQEVDTEKEPFKQLQQGVERIQHLIEQLLSLHRTSPDQFASDSARLDLLEITEEVVARYYPSIEKKQQALELEGATAFIKGERFALETLVANLVSNASRYTPAGGRVLLRIEHRQGDVCLLVEDNGPGIPLAEREYVFNRFYRGSIARQAGGAGCGLGLAIVRHVADLHQAAVSVEDSVLGGVAFRVCFPEASDEI